jgi:hypothetical protein
MKNKKENIVLVPTDFSEVANCIDHAGYLKLLEKSNTSSL